MPISVATLFGDRASINGFVFCVLLLWEKKFQGGQRDRVFMCFTVINEQYCRVYNASALQQTDNRGNSPAAGNSHDFT